MRMMATGVSTNLFKNVPQRLVHIIGSMRCVDASYKHLIYFLNWFGRPIDNILEP